MTISNMRNNLHFFSIVLTLLAFGCSKDHNTSHVSDEYEIPTSAHNLSYIPYDTKLDSPDYLICDSTKMGSGRSRVRYIDGTDKLKEAITSNYLYDQKYATFSGYIVIRFLVNCEGKSGRYRAQALNLDFSPSNAPSALLKHSTELIKSLDNWTKSTRHDSKAEYSKFINLKIKNGKIQHVLL